MKAAELTALMHTVLDAEATRAEAAALEQQLAADPAARAEFEQARELYRQLGVLPQPFPPEGLVATVAAGLARSERHQPFQSRRVLASSPAQNPGQEPDRTSAASATRHRPSPSTWRASMTQQSSSIFANRKTWIGAGVALVALVVVVQFGFDGKTKKEDVAGTVVPAERYRAAQPAAQEIKLGDQAVAQLLQNDTFVRMIKDPQVRAMALDPGFQAAAQAMLASPEAAKVLLANAEVAKYLGGNTEAAKAVLSNAEAARAMAANSEAARALMLNAEAAKFLSAHPQAAKFMAANAEASKYLGGNTEAAKFTAANAEAANFMVANVEAAKAVLQNAEVAKFMASNAEAAKFMAANTEAAKFALSYAEAAKYLGGNTEAAKMLMAHPEAAKVLMANPEAARLLAQSPDAARFLLGNAEAAKMLMANPQASRALMQSPQANISAMYQSLDANKAATN